MNSEKNLIKIGTFSDAFQANMAKEILQSNGINCIITGDEFRLFDRSADHQPIQLLVNETDQKSAEELLAVFFSGQT